MKPAAIKSDRYYTNGEDYRQVIEVFCGGAAALGQWRVMWRNVGGGDLRECSLAAFARWAKAEARLKYPEGRNAR